MKEPINTASCCVSRFYCLRIFRVLVTINFFIYDFNLLLSTFSLNNKEIKTRREKKGWKEKKKKKIFWISLAMRFQVFYSLKKKFYFKSDKCNNRFFKEMWAEQGWSKRHLTYNSISVSLIYLCVKSIWRIPYLVVFGFCFG